jgi:RND family efflux transporter MFP subunit
MAKRVPDSANIVLPSGMQAIQYTTLNARTAGYVSARYVDIGSRVKQGQVLAVIQSPEVDEQVSQTQADIAKSQAGLGQAEAEASRLSAGISTSRSMESESKTAVLQTEADLAHLRAKELQSEAAVAVDNARYQASLKQLAGARANLNRAHVDEAIAKVTLDRWRQLEKADAVAGQDVDEKQSDWESSEARVEAASAAVSSAQADVDAARETVRSAQADVQAAKADIQSGTQRIRSAESAVHASQSNVQAAISGYNASRSSVEAARAAIASTQANYRRVAALQSFENIVAPFSGVITARNVDVGDLVNATTSGSGATNPLNTVTKTGLFGLAKTDVLRAEVSVPEDAITAIHQGQEADITFSELPGQSFRGTVFNVSGALDMASRTELVELRIPNPNGSLKPGMYAEIHFLGSKGRMIVQVPGNAVLFDNRGTRVAIVRADGTLHYADVKVGRDYGNRIDIREGLRGGEKVVTNPDSSIPEGTRVTARADML